MFWLAFRSIEFFFYHVLITAVDRVSAVPRETVLPDAERLYRENIAVKAQLDALEAYIQRIDAARRPPVPVGVRAAQVFAYLLTHRNEPFQRYFLSASLATIWRWLRLFRSWPGRPTRTGGGRPPLDEKIVEQIVTLKKENRSWGAKRIQQELRRLGVRVSQPTIQKVLRAYGYLPRPGHRASFDRFLSSAKDAVWAIDFFAVQAAKGHWFQVLLVIDVHTRELMDLRVHDGWDVDSAWVARNFNALLARTKRTPTKVVHDHGTHFMFRFAKALRVLEIEREVTPVMLPIFNCYAERAIGSVRRELLRYVRLNDAAKLQTLLDEYRAYATTARAHQGIAGRTPREFGTDVPIAPILDLAALRTKRLERRTAASGLLNSYVLVDDATTPQAA